GSIDTLIPLTAGTGPPGPRYVFFRPSMWMPACMNATVTDSVENLTRCIITQVTGLRETKKRRTRETIAQAAADLFHERGFAAVTVDDVARAADVSRQTVFNYFPSKEQMLFDRE